MDKKQLRLEVLQKLKSMPKDIHRQKSKTLTSKLITSNEWIYASTIGVTISNYPEVDTSFLINEAKKQNKRIVVPKCNPITKEMEFYEWNKETLFEKVYANIIEPIPSSTKKYSYDSIDLLIVPGIVFNIEGYRIGFGGGYYDRYLANYKGSTISLVMSEQLNEQIPLNIYDRKVKKMIIY